MDGLGCDQLELVAEHPAGAIARHGDQLIVLIHEASTAGWTHILAALASIGVGPDAHMTQIAWWADGAELWLVEP